MCTGLAASITSCSWNWLGACARHNAKSFSRQKKKKKKHARKKCSLCWHDRLKPWAHHLPAIFQRQPRPNNTGKSVCWFAFQTKNKGEGGREREIGEGKKGGQIWRVDKINVHANLILLLSFNPIVSQVVPLIQDRVSCLSIQPVNAQRLGPLFADIWNSYLLKSSLNYSCCTSIMISQHPRSKLVCDWKCFCCVFCQKVTATPGSLFAGPVVRMAHKHGF